MYAPIARAIVVGSLMCSAVVCRLASAQSAGSESVTSVDFFESKIRPALVEHCLECHSSQTEASGGLLLDSKAAWQRGGESGEAIVPGQPQSSRLLLAISYEDPELKMPPDGKLPREVREAFSQWITDGANDPRTLDSIEMKPQTGLPVDQAQEHWAYRKLAEIQVPPTNQTRSISAIDYFINRRLEEKGLQAAVAAQSPALVRRLYYDLLGLPPTPSEVAALVADLNDTDFDDSDLNDPAQYQRLVEHLLESPQYGEHMARKWMDVARYAESITLRGFVLPEAWRYRDYLIQAYSEDRPFDQMIREQIAGDLLQCEDLRQRQMQLTATAFLALGNTNLEQQDKAQLEMDYVDEQLEVIGRAFLAQTIGCARCHDHKFDPIPTRDYYAMAGILRSAVALEHDNVSKWIEQPLPLPDSEQQHFDDLRQSLKTTEQLIASNKKQNSQASDRQSVAMAELSGIVIDNPEAKLVGSWQDSTSVGRYVGVGYIHDGNSEKGMKTATFEPVQLAPGAYEVRFAYTAAQNRATNTLVRVFSADGEATILVNQQLRPTDDGIWFSLGEYRFEKDGQAFVLISNDQADGTVIADAVQFLNLDRDASRVAIGNATDIPSKTVQPDALKSAAAVAQELRDLEAQKKKLEKQLELRPQYLTLIEKLPPANIPVHIRGDVHNLGAIVPRGFLTALDVGRPSTIPQGSSGRLELADWLSSKDNPLTARVYANRVWYWLMGQGIVPTVNNFGTTGVAPTHPELLDWLAAELIRSGWSTKHLVKIIVCSDAYRRRVAAADAVHSQVDPANSLYWRGASRRLAAEPLRDAMLSISGELDLTLGGSLIRSGTKADYDYQHESTRRSIYHPVFRNSLPELFEAFDFADSSVSIGQRPRSTVATQALVLLNHPWVAARATATANRIRSSHADQDTERLIDDLYQQCFFRRPSTEEKSTCRAFMENVDPSDASDRLSLLVQSLFAAVDFRYLD